MEKIQRPTQLQTPSIDFSKPRLVQITVTDVGACMPLQPMVSVQYSTCYTCLCMYMHVHVYYRHLIYSVHVHQGFPKLTKFCSCFSKILPTTVDNKGRLYRK